MLTPKQLLFAHEYGIDGNATQAAIRAGYSEDSAASIGHENLTKPEIRSEVDRLRENAVERAYLNADMVLEGIKRTTLKAEEQGQYSAAPPGYELLGKHLKLFTDKQEISTEAGGFIGVVVDRGMYEDGKLIVDL